MSTEELKSDLYLVFALTMSGTNRWGTKLNEQGKRIYGIDSVDSKDTYKQMLEDKEFNDDDFEDFDFGSEAEMLDEAYRNSYLVVTKKTTFKKLMKEKGDVTFFAFDPSEPETLEFVIDDIIEYFEDCEEYEKCAELIEVKNKINDA